MRRLTCYLLVPCLAVFAVLFWISPRRVAAQAQQSDTLVIEGGTLIDGNGGAPVPDAVVIIQGNKITSVSRKGQASYPPTAQVIHADGKFILPGYWEVEDVWKWYVGESEFNYGVTSVSDIGEGGDIAMLQNRAIQHHRVISPRLWTGIARIGPLSTDYVGDDTESFTTPFRAGQYPKSAEDAREIAKRMLTAGAELVNSQGGTEPLEYYRALIDEAHKAGKPAFVRPSGPIFNVRDAIDMNADILSQSMGIALGVAKDPSKFAGGVRVTGLEVGNSLPTDELDVYADMDDAKAAELIKLLVQHKMTLQPNMIRKGAGFHRENDLFQAETLDWWASNPALQAYYPEEMYQSEILEMTPKVMPSEEWTRRMKGYQNMMRFNRDFAKAGGHLLVGCNAPFIRPPGLCVHQELQLFADAGLTPMELIEAVTKWPAEAYGALNQLGTIEVAKTADLVIINADPLQDHRNLQKINTVIYDGKVQELGYHADYALRQPFRGGAGLDMNLTVEGLEWVSAYKKSSNCCAGHAPAAPPGGPVRVNPPAIEAISPYLVEEGSPSVTLTIKGFFFDERCLVYFDNKIVPYKLVSPTEMQVTLENSLLLRPGVFEVFVKQPGPLINQQSWHASDGISNKAHFLVDFKY